MQKASVLESMILNQLAELKSSADCRCMLSFSWKSWNLGLAPFAFLWSKREQHRHR